jgi:hypothetical protein
VPFQVRQSLGFTPRPKSEASLDVRLEALEGRSSPHHPRAEIVGSMGARQYNNHNQGFMMGRWPKGVVSVKGD